MPHRDSANSYSLHYGLIFHLLSAGSGSLHQPLPCRWLYHTTPFLVRRFHSRLWGKHQCSRGVLSRI